jgi:hypothetical protein
VRIDLRSEKPATLVRIFYAGEQDGDVPFEFTIKAGRQKLLLVASGAERNQRMRIVELSGRDVCQLRNFFWSPTNFSTVLDIEGA